MLYDRYSLPGRPQVLKPHVPGPLKEVVKKRLDNQGVIGEDWLATNGGGLSYSLTFGTLLARHFRFPMLADFPEDQRRGLELELMHGESRILPNIITEETKRKGRELRVLDLMSQGAFHTALGLQGAVVGLVDTRSPNQKAFHQQSGTEYLEGDVHDIRLWGRLRDITRRDGGFDMVIARPQGGLYDVVTTDTFYGLLLTRMYRLLDQDNGILLTEYDGIMHGVVEGQAARLNTVPGISALHDRGPATFMLVRGQGAPSAREFKDMVLRGK